MFPPGPLSFDPRELTIFVMIALDDPRGGLQRTNNQRGSAGLTSVLGPEDQAPNLSA